LASTVWYFIIMPCLLHCTCMYSTPYGSKHPVPRTTGVGPLIKGYSVVSGLISFSPSRLALWSWHGTQRAMACMLVRPSAMADSPRNRLGGLGPLGTPFLPPVSLALQRAQHRRPVHEPGLPPSSTPHFNHLRTHGQAFWLSLAADHRNQSRRPSLVKNRMSNSAI
jgi:hypothetical protein